MLWPEKRCPRSYRRLTDLLHADLGMACADEAKLCRRGPGKIYDPALDERSAIIDPHDDGFAVALVGDLDLRAEGKRAMCRCHGGGVHTLAGCRFRPKSIPGCTSTLSRGVNYRKGEKNCCEA